MSYTDVLLQVISLRFCYTLVRDKIRFAGSALSYDFEAKRCENIKLTACRQYWVVYELHQTQIFGSTQDNMFLIFFFSDAH